jgi:hypothetical protein
MFDFCYYKFIRFILDLDNLDPVLSNQTASNLEYASNQTVTILLPETDLTANQSPHLVDNALTNNTGLVTPNISLENSLIHRLLSGDNLSQNTQ